ncbi:MAG: hypothetical protein J6N67_05565 [Desulfovibrio sp.]|nr:hypothetical protein [Desulfovibrio sp.]
MNRHSFLLTATLLSGLLLAACDSGPDREPAPEESGAAASESAPARPASPEVTPRSPAAALPPSASDAGEAAAAPPSPEELARADSLVAFANAASMALASGKYAQTDVLAAYTEYYLAEWQLARRPKIDAEADAALSRRLVPPKGLFTPDQEKELAAYAKNMNKAIADMRADYRALEDYVEDASIQDDGARGKQLGERILRAHAVYTAARDGWLRIVEGLSDPAEEFLLQGHPLRRQILAANRIFAVHRTMAQLLTLPRPDREALAALGRDMEADIAEAGRPPFMAPPAVERPFRQFLKDAAAYRQGIARGAAEGFHNAVREELNRAVLACRSAYNEFVRVANEAHVRVRHSTPDF